MGTAQTKAEQLFTSARAGSPSCLSELLALYANYLKLLVAAQLDTRLRVRVSPSDIVQESFFEAHRDFAEFRGRSIGEFVALLRGIVVNNIFRVVSSMCSRKSATCGARYRSKKSVAGWS